MKVILNEDIKGIGQKGQIIEVADGYGRNFLLKKKKAILATESGIKEVKAINEKMAKKKAAEIQEAKDLAAKLEGQEIVFYEKVGTEGRLFGAVTNKEICEQVNKIFNLNFDKKKFDLKDTIKHLGTEHCKIKIFPGVSAEIKVRVEAKE